MRAPTRCRYVGPVRVARVRCSVSVEAARRKRPCADRCAGRGHPRL